VLARSAYSDIAFVDALLRMGWLTKNCEHSFIYVAFFMYSYNLVSSVSLMV